MWSPSGDRIAFTSDRDGDYEIYVMNSDGTNLTKVTENSDDDSDPTWSPDGQKVAFVSNRDGNDEIYIKSSDGTGYPQRITDDPGVPTGTPHGRPTGAQSCLLQTARAGPFGYYFFELYSINADGYGIAQLTELERNSFEPAWSPDGSQIAFQSRREIHLMTADGSRLWQPDEDPNWSRENPNRLPRHEHRHPTWSPDGKRIAYSSIREDGNVDIYSMQAGGQGVVRLTDSPGLEWHPAWSPDGQLIAFVSNVDGEYGVYVIDAEDVFASGIPATDLNAVAYALRSEPPKQDQHIVRSNLPPGRGHDWSPDGRYVVYGDNGEIYITRSDGSNVTRLTYNSDSDRSPRWLPDGTRIAFESDRDGGHSCWIVNAGWVRPLATYSVN